MNYISVTDLYKFHNLLLIEERRGAGAQSFGASYTMSELVHGQDDQNLGRWRIVVAPVV